MRVTDRRVGQAHAGCSAAAPVVIVGPIDSAVRRLDQKVWLDSIPTGEPAAGPLDRRLWPPAVSG